VKSLERQLKNCKCSAGQFAKPASSGTPKFNPTSINKTNVSTPSKNETAVNEDSDEKSADSAIAIGIKGDENNELTVSL
jgi:hypothetical protein